LFKATAAEQTRKQIGHLLACLIPSKSSFGDTRQDLIETQMSRFCLGQCSCVSVFGHGTYQRRGRGDIHANMSSVKKNIVLPTLQLKYEPVPSIIIN
jgi:hypothetical protein